VDRAADLNGSGRQPGLSEVAASVDWQGKTLYLLAQRDKKCAPNFFTCMY
jgi:hypothetical protein